MLHDVGRVASEASCRITYDDYIVGWSLVSPHPTANHQRCATNVINFTGNIEGVGLRDNRNVARIGALAQPYEYTRGMFMVHAHLLLYV